MTALLAAIALQGPLAEVPFEHAPGRIWMRATLNGQKVDALLDTGANGLYAFEEAAERARGSKGDAFKVFGLGESAATAWYADNLRFGLEGTNVDVAVPFILAPAQKLVDTQPIHVAAGFDFLLRYAVEIDYPNQKLRLFNPWTYHPAAGMTEQRIRFVNRRPIVEIDVEVPGGSVKRLTALFDTGAPMGFEFTRKAAVREGLDTHLKDVTVEKGTPGISGATNVRRVSKLRWQIAGFPMTSDATVSMTQGGANGSEADFDVLIGDAALRRFDLVFDYWRGRIFLKPNGR